MKKLVFLIVLFFQIAKAECITPPFERLSISEHSFMFMGDLLYWQAWREHLEYTWVMVPIHPLDPSKANIDRLTLPHKWDLGYRIGMGYGAHKDGWRLSLHWTRFHTTLVESKSENTPILATLFLQPIGDTGLQNGGWRALHARGEWKLSFDTLDFQIGREYWLSHCLHVYPHIGLKVSWIDQDFTTSYTSVFSPNDTFPFPPFMNLGNHQYNDKSESWGIGPRAGFSSYWKWCFGWSLTGEVAGALVWSELDQTTVKRSSSSKQTLFDERCEELWPSLQMGIGLDWGSSFWTQCFWMGFQVKYETQIWWGRSTPNLCLQGLTISGSIAF